jgi:hypothetical protein
MVDSITAVKIVTSEKTLELSFPLSEGWEKFDVWLSKTFPVTGSGAGLGQRDVSISVDEPAVPFTLRRIKAVAKGMGINSLEDRVI